MLLKNKDLPHHLLVLRASAMGDVAMLPHALRALLTAYPDLKVTVMTRQLFTPFFVGLPVDFLYIEPQDAHKGPMGLLQLATAARDLGVDALADVHDVLRSQFFRQALRLYGVRSTHIKKGHFEKWMRLGGASTSFAVPLKPTVIRYCDTFRQLGFVFDDPQPPIKVPHPNPMGEKKGIWIGIAPFSAQQGKIYPLPLMKEVVDGLSGRYDRIFIHSGGDEELAFAQEMERTHPNVTTLFNRIKLADEMDLIANLDCVVSMDSLVMHLASLTATPVVSVWGATHPILGFMGYGCDAKGVVQQEGLPCRPCSVYGKKPCKFGDYHCLSDIAPAEIVSRVATIIRG
ncbi:MAG: glycosyltransferase family 9 protein [Alistipes sp.]